MTAIPSDFPWRAAMVYITPDGVRGRIVDDNDHVRPVSGVKIYRPGKTLVWPMPGGVTTDLTDPATLGAFLGAVREAWRDPAMYAAPSTMMWNDGTPQRWSVYTGSGRGPVGSGSTETAALLAAWNARPKASA